MADVLDVDPVLGPYFEVRDAVAAASPGDTVRVTPGLYGYFGIFGKGITVIGTGPGVVIEGGVRVQNVPAGQVASLDGLMVVPPPATEALIAADCPGSLRVHECQLWCEDLGGSTGPFFFGARIERCDDVAMVATSAKSDGTAGATVEDSVVAFYGCFFEGRSNNPCELSNGGAGLRIVRSEAVMWDCTALGGSGGFQSDQFCSVTAGNCLCYRGGHGVEAISSTLVAHGGSHTGGLGSTVSNFHCFCSEPAGEPIFQLHSQVTIDTGRAPFLSSTPTLVQEGETVDVAIQGEAGDEVYLIAATEAQSQVLPGAAGHLLLHAPNGGRRVYVGSIGSSTTLNWSFSAPELPAASEMTLHIQTAHVRPTGGFVLGPVSVVTVLDSAW